MSSRNKKATKKKKKIRGGVKPAGDGKIKTEERAIRLSESNEVWCKRVMKLMGIEMVREVGMRIEEAARASKDAREAWLNDYDPGVSHITPNSLSAADERI